MPPGSRDQSRKDMVRDTLKMMHCCPICGAVEWCSCTDEQIQEWLDDRPIEEAVHVEDVLGDWIDIDDL